MMICVGSQPGIIYSSAYECASAVCRVADVVCRMPDFVCRVFIIIPAAELGWPINGPESFEHSPVVLLQLEGSVALA